MAAPWPSTCDYVHGGRRSASPDRSGCRRFAPELSRMDQGSSPGAMWPTTGTRSPPRGSPPTTPSRCTPARAPTPATTAIRTVGAATGTGGHRDRNISVARQQLWIGYDHVGRAVGLRVDTTAIQLSLDGVGGPHFKTVPSRLTTTHLARLRTAGAVPAGPPPVPVTAARGAPAGAVVEVDRVVNASGLIGLGNRYVSVGQPLAGQTHHAADRRRRRARRRQRRPGTHHPGSGPTTPAGSTDGHPAATGHPGDPTPNDHGAAEGVPRRHHPGRRADPAGSATRTATPSSTSTSMRPSSASTASTANSWPQSRKPPPRKSPDTRPTVELTTSDRNCRPSPDAVLSRIS
jgi:hypothetical protein